MPSPSDATSVRARIEVIPTGAALGAELRGVDLRDIDDQDFADDPPRLDRSSGAAVPRPAPGRRRADRLQPPLRRAGLGADPGERPPLRRRLPGDLRRFQRDRERRRHRQPRRRRGGVAHRHVLSARTRPRRACSTRWRSRPTGGNTGFSSMYRAYETLPRRAAPAHRRQAGEARRHLQQRRLCAPGRHADRRSGFRARNVPSAGVHASRQLAARPVSRAPAQRLYRGTVAGGVRSAARRNLGLCHARRADLVQHLAGRRPGAVGQSLHHAPARAVRSAARAGSCTARRSRARRRRSA